MLVLAKKSGFLPSEPLKNTTTDQLIKPTNHVHKTTMKNISKHTYRRGKRNSIKSKQQIFSALGVNTNGIRRKWSSFQNVISKLKPLIWSIQETKCVREGGLKLNGFRVFEHVRNTQDGGGGLALGCSTKLSPVLTRTGGDEVEAITVNIRIKNMNILCCTSPFSRL